MIAAGWYTPVSPNPAEPQAYLVWGIAVIIAFLLGYVARRSGRPPRIRDYFDALNASLRHDAFRNGGDFDEELGIASPDQGVKTGPMLDAGGHQMDSHSKSRFPPSSLN